MLAVSTIPSILGVHSRSQTGKGTSTLPFVILHDFCHHHALTMFSSWELTPCMQRLEVGWSFQSLKSDHDICHTFLTIVITMGVTKKRPCPRGRHQGLWIKTHKYVTKVSPKHHHFVLNQTSPYIRTVVKKIPIRVHLSAHFFAVSLHFQDHSLWHFLIASKSNTILYGNTCFSSLNRQQVNLDNASSKSKCEISNHMLH